MPSPQVVSVSSTVRFEATGPDQTTVTVTNLGPDSCYYATASTVSAGSNDGTLAAGAVLAFVPSKFFISSGTSRLQVEIKPAVPYALIRPTGVLYETFPLLTQPAGTTHAPATQRISAAIIPDKLKAGVPITGLSCVSSGAAVTPTNQWAMLFRRSDGTVLVKSADQTTTAWGANTLRAFLWTYTPSQDEDVYAATVQVAATPATLQAQSLTNNLSGKFAPTRTCFPAATLTDPASQGATVTIASGLNEIPYYALMA